MNRDTIIRLAGAAGMRASTAQPAVNAIGRTVPVEWLEQFAALIGAEVRKEIEAAHRKPTHEEVADSFAAEYKAEIAKKAARRAALPAGVCPECEGAGHCSSSMHHWTCPDCNGTGRTQPAPGGAA